MHPRNSSSFPTSQLCHKLFQNCGLPGWQSLSIGKNMDIYICYPPPPGTYLFAILCGLKVAQFQKKRHCFTSESLSKYCKWCIVYIIPAFLKQNACPSKNTDFLKRTMHSEMKKFFKLKGCFSKRTWVFKFIVDIWKWKWLKQSIVVFPEGPL